jgi:hypothetical protein
VHGKTVTTEEISAYAAVAIAGLGWLPDTILTRSVIVRMRRRRADEQVAPFQRSVAAPAGERIRMSIVLWTRGVPPEIDWPTIPPEIQDRDADVWEPLLVADLAGGDWPRRARRAAKALVEVAKETEPTFGILLLTHLKAVFGDAEKWATEAVLKRLHEIEEAPWVDLKGKPLDDRGLARRLREYGIKSRTVRIGSTTPRGYERKDFLDAWARYLPSLRTSATSTTSATPGSEIPPADVKRAENKTDATLFADVVQFREGGGNVRPPCAHCGKPGATLQCYTAENTEGAWLHRDCERAWVTAQTWPDIPDCLRRAT